MPPIKNKRGKAAQTTARAPATDEMIEVELDRALDKTAPPVWLPAKVLNGDGIDFCAVVQSPGSSWDGTAHELDMGDKDMARPSVANVCASRDRVGVLLRGVIASNGVLFRETTNKPASSSSSSSFASRGPLKVVK